MACKGLHLVIKSGAASITPRCSGLQVQGTAKSPAARKLYDIFGIADQTIFFSIALIPGFVNAFCRCSQQQKNLRDAQNLY